MGGTEDFVCDPLFADWVWNHIKSSPRVYWPDDERLTYQTEAGFETKKWYRSGSWDREVPDMWRENTGFGVPDFTGHPGLDFRKDLVRSVYLAGVSYTVVGSWYTFEMKEDEDTPLMLDPIRLPVTQDMVSEAKAWGRDWGGSFVREKDVEFKERFATVLDDDEAFQAAAQLNDVHLKIGNIESERRAKNIFREATDMAERAVRSVL